MGKWSIWNLFLGVPTASGVVPEPKDHSWLGENVTRTQFEALEAAYLMGKSKYKPVWKPAPRTWPKSCGYSFPNYPVYPWVPMEREQAQSRLDRVGKGRYVMQWYMSPADIDRQILRNLMEKEKASMSTMRFKIQHKRIPVAANRLSTKEQALFKALQEMGVDTNRLVERARNQISGHTVIICKPEQFAQFLVTRHDNGGENWFAELEPLFGDGKTDGKTTIIDVTQYKANAAFGDSTVGERTYGKRAELAMAYGAGSSGVQFILDNAVKDAKERARDAALEEVAKAFDARAKRTEEKNRFAPARYQHLAQQAVKRSEFNAKFVRDMKGGKTAADALAAGTKEGLQKNFAPRNKMFSIKVEGTRKDVRFYNQDITLLKVEGEDVFLHVNDKRLDWTTADGRRVGPWLDPANRYRKD